MRLLCKIKKKTVTALAAVLLGAVLPAGATVVRGIVRDSLTTEPIPYASVQPSGGETPVLTDSMGIFQINVSPSTPFLSAVSQGYARKRIPLWTNSFNLYDIELRPRAEELAGVEVRSRRYSKRNNPAVDFVNRLRRASGLTDPFNAPFFGYHRYERVAIGIDEYDTTRVGGRFSFLADMAEVSPLTGKTILTMSVNEKVSEVAARRDPRQVKETVTGLARQGVDEMMEMDNVQTMIFDIAREVDLWDSDIMLMRNSFVSPLSPLGPDFYRYYLVDTAVVGADTCTVLAFYPRNSASTGFAGHLYVARDDSAMFVHRAELHTRPEISLNFIDRLLLTQEFERGPRGERLKVTDDLVAEMRILPGTPRVFLSRRIAQRGHTFEERPDSLYGFLGASRTVDGARERDDAFWLAARAIPQSRGEGRVGELMHRLREQPLYYWSELILQRMFTGYWPTGRPSRFDIGPLNTIASYNGLEGLRLRAGGMTTAALNPHWFGRAYVAHGFRDHRWKYGAEIEYSFAPKRVHSREFPIHSLRLSHSYDVDRLGSHYLFTNSDNFVLSLTRMSYNLETYRRQTRLQYTLELGNHFSVEASALATTQFASPYVRFARAGRPEVDHYNQMGLEVQLRFAPGESFIQERSTRIPTNLDAPVFVLRHFWSPRRLGGAMYNVARTEFNFSKRFWLSLAGKLDVDLGAGQVWTAAPFTELLIPNANISYTIQPGSFALMNPMEFINSTYLSWDLTYRPQGLLFNLIPGVKRLGWREIVGFRGIWGTLGSACQPSEGNNLFLFPPQAHTRRMDSGPYMELSAGIDNLFRCLRVDYVWRLSYRRNEVPVDRAGLRVALHLTF